MSEYAAFRSGRDAPARIATSVVMFAEANELLPEEPMYQPVIPFYPDISSGSGSTSVSAIQEWTNYPTRCDLTFYQGDDVTVPLTILDPADTTPDLSTEWEWAAQIRVLHTYYSTLVSTFAVKDAYTPPVGDTPGFTEVTLFLPRTENVYVGTYHWDLYSKAPLDASDFSQPPEVITPEPWPPTDQIRTWIYGEVTILPRVTSTDYLPVPVVVVPTPPVVGVFGNERFFVGPNGQGSLMGGIVISAPTKPILVTVPQGKPGPQGVPGPPGAPAVWTQMTQAEYDALPTKDPDTLYVIIG